MGSLDKHIMENLRADFDRASVDRNRVFIREQCSWCSLRVKREDFIPWWEDSDRKASASGAGSSGKNQDKHVKCKGGR